MTLVLPSRRGFQFMAESSGKRARTGSCERRDGAEDEAIAFAPATAFAGARQKEEPIRRLRIGTGVGTGTRDSTRLFATMIGGLPLAACLDI
jgi:hypothetical protein